jgi:hypothetical protein
MKDPHISYKRTITPTNPRNRNDTTSIFTKRKYEGVVFKSNEWRFPSLGKMPYFMR